jgi:hypothetical protein
MVIADMNTEKIAVFAMVTMVPWTSSVEDDPHIQGAGAPCKGEPAQFQKSVSWIFLRDNLWKILLPNHS